MNIKACPKVLVLDLEMNQPSKKIIEIGAVVAHSGGGEIIDTLNIRVNPTEYIAPFITELTGITQQDADSGKSLTDAYLELRQMAKKHRCHKQVLVWGRGDLELLQKQLNDIGGIKNIDNWWFPGNRYTDVKTIFQFFCLAKGKTMKGGLQTACGRLGIDFEGQPHRAADDALNTFRVFYHLLKQIRPEKA